VTFIDEILSLADAKTYTTNAMSVPQAFAGPVKLTNNVNEVTTFTATTTSGAAYQELNCDLTGFDYISFSVTTNAQLEGGFIAFYDVNDPNHLNNAYWLNPFKYQAGFTLGYGVDQPKTFNLNVKNYVPAPNGAAMTAWVYWKNGRFSAGMGVTVGVNPVVLDQELTPHPVNRMMIKSNGMDATWIFPTRFCGSK
jgi:hypothetical protein